MARILIIDDEENIRSSLKSALERREHTVATAESVAQGREFVSGAFDLIFLDVMLPDGNGVDLLKWITKRDPRQTVVMISGHADIDTAVEAIRVGAYDFIEKPISLDRVLVTIDNACRTTSLAIQKDRLSSQLYGEFIGESGVIRTLKAEVRKAAGLTDRFLVLGENGTGKELIAHMIHTLGQFADGPFVAVNCAALPSELVEAELFGHVAGAFTGAGRARNGRFVEASGGSIFLDEISEMSPEAQAKILRVIETRQVTPVGSDKSLAIRGNIIAASNRDLRQMIQEKKFREDLYHRLNVVSFNIPPLRERRDDISLLAAHFLARFTFETKTTKTFSKEALEGMKQLHLAGNTRELKNLVERINIYCEGPQIEPEDIREFLPSSPTASARSLKESVEQFEIEQITSAINRNSGSVAKAARELGLERSHLYKKMKKLKMR